MTSYQSALKKSSSSGIFGRLNSGHGTTGVVGVTEDRPYGYSPARPKINTSELVAKYTRVVASGSKYRPESGTGKYSSIGKDRNGYHSSYLRDNGNLNRAAGHAVVHSFNLVTKPEIAKYNDIPLSSSAMAGNQTTDSNSSRMVSNSWTRVKLDYYQEQQKKLLEKIEIELGKKNIYDSQLVLDVKQRNYNGLTRDINFGHDYNRIIEDLEHTNRDKRIKIERIIHEINAFETQMWDN